MKSSRVFKILAILASVSSPALAQSTAPARLTYPAVPLSNYWVNWDWARNEPVLVGTCGGHPRSYTLEASVFLTCMDGSGFDHATYRTTDEVSGAPIYVILGYPEANLTVGKPLTFRDSDGGETYFRVNVSAGSYTEIGEVDPR